MAIPENQLETWSHQGSVRQSKDTYAAVKRALEDQNAAYKTQEHSIFLQGSYGNDTNIYAESDVDTVIRLDSIMRCDVSRLPQEQQDAYHQQYGTATYTFDEFKRGVDARLSAAFGSDARPSNKAIKIKASGSRRSADVVVCYQYRRYSKFISANDQDFVPGIIFPSVSSGEVINFPKRHSDNLTAKHQATNTWFKPMVRIVKNMRTRLVDEGIIKKDTAPSYYIEGLLHSVPTEKFGGSYGDTFCNCVNWLVHADRSKLRCAHGQTLLLGNSNVQWPSSNCDEILDALVGLWNNW